MSGRDIRDTIGLLAVVASLVFVGLQIRQGTVAQQSATIEGIFAQRTDFNLATATDEGLISLVRRVNEGATSSDFTADEVQEGRMWLLAYLRIIEAAQRQVEIGVLSGQEMVNTFESLRPVASRPFFQEQWPTLQNNFAPDFISYLDAEFIQ